jgi:hypothetical protein
MHNCIDAIIGEAEDRSIICIISVIDGMEAHTREHNVLTVGIVVQTLLQVK